MSDTYPYHLDPDGLAEDFRWLLDSGTPIHEAVSRVGYSGRLSALEKRFYRAGHTDLARIINRIRNQERHLVGAA